MYRRFLNNNDYLSVITESALAQMTRGREDCIVQAEESAEMSILEYLSENYEIEHELNTGKYIADYDRRITFPVGAHLYFNGQLCKVIRSISGYKAPTAIDHWEEVCDPNVNVDDVALYSQFKTYYPGDKAVYNGICYVCLAENGHQFGEIRMPMVSGWQQLYPSAWTPIQYEEIWEVVEHNGEFYTLLSTDDFDCNVNPYDSPNWGAIADYDPNHNRYELSGYDYVVWNGCVFRPEIDVNADIPEMGVNLTPHDPRNYNLKKHMVRLAIYELTKLIAPNNVSTVRIRDYEESRKWLNDASKLRIDPKIPRKLSEDRKEIMDWQLATFQTDYDPWKNPWMT